MVTPYKSEDQLLFAQIKISDIIQQTHTICRHSKDEDSNYLICYCILSLVVSLQFAQCTPRYQKIQKLHGPFQCHQAIVLFYLSYVQ